MIEVQSGVRTGFSLEHGTVQSTVHALLIQKTFSELYVDPTNTYDIQKNFPEGLVIGCPTVQLQEVTWITGVQALKVYKV